MAAFDLKKFVPHLLSILVIFVVTFLFFKPEFTDGLSLKQDDMLNYRGVVQELKAFQAKTGEVSMWSGSMFSGIPAYIFFPTFNYGVLPYVEKAFKGFMSDSTGGHLFFLSAVCMYILLLSFKVRFSIALIGALSFALTSYNLILIEVGHVTKLWALSYGCLILAGIRLAFTNRLWLGIGLTALAMALEVRAAHYQITFYLGFVCVFYVLSEIYFAQKEKNITSAIKISTFLLVAVALGFATNAGKLMTTMEYQPYSTRGKAELSAQSGTGKDKGSQGGLDRDYAFDWSQGKGETFTLLIPMLYGGASQEELDDKSNFYQAIQGQLKAGERIVAAPTYWGDQPFTMGPIYAGAVVCFFFVLGLLTSDNRLRAWLLAGVLITMMFAWGRNFEMLNYTLYDHFPGFNKFRSVSMALSVSILLMVLMACVALENVLEKELDKTLLKNIAISFALTGGLALVIAGIAGMLNYAAPVDQQLGEQGAAIMRLDRIALARGSAWRSFFFIAAVAATLYYSLKRKLPMPYGFGIIAALMIGDLWFVGKKYLNYDSFKKSPINEAFLETEADKVILKDNDPNFRVLNLLNPFNEAITSYHHKSIGGYFAVKMRRYQDLIEHNLQTEIETGIQSLQKTGNPDFEKYKVINMLNAKYIKFGAAANNVLQNPNAMGNAWFVQKIEQVASPDEEINALSKVDLKTTAILDKNRFDVKTTNFDMDSTASIKLLSYKPNELVYECNSSKNSFAVFSEIYYPEAWKATIDGQEAKILNVNYVLRGLEMPQGKHKIVFRFESPTYETGNLITMISSYLVIFTVLGAIVLVFIKAKNQDNEN